MKFFIKNLSVIDKKDKKKFYFLIFLSVIATLFEVLGIGLMVPFILIISSEGIENKNEYINIFVNLFNIGTKYELILISVFIIFTIFLIKLCFLSLLSWYKFKFSYLLQNKLSLKVLKILLSQPYIYFSKLNSSNLLQETRDDPAVYVTGMIIGKIDFISELLIVISVFLLLISYSFVPSLILIFIIISIIILYRLVFKKITIKWSIEKKHFQVKSYNILKYAYNSITELKINSKEEYLLSKFYNFEVMGSRNLTKQMFIIDMPKISLEFLAVILFLMFIIFSFKFSNDFNHVLPTIALFSLSAFRVLPSINRIIVGIQKINFSKNSFVTLSRIFNSKVTSNNFIEKKVSFEKYFNLDKVSFKYGHKEILSDISLKIDSKGIIGIKGPSGSGKTTLVNLMLGLLEPYSGQLLLDGQKLDYNNLNWLKIVSYAPQKTYILDDTILNNICFLQEEKHIDFDHLKYVIKISGLDEVIKNLESGMETIIGENGSKLSGGQIQRIGFARSIYKKPKFLVLDEITSSLDSKNENIILNSIKELSKVMSIIIISHRNETLKICDKIYELQNKKLNLSINA